MIRFVVIFFLFSVSRAVASDFGLEGFLKTPNARMFNDGELRLTISRERVSDTYNLTYQATPWLQTTFRYSIFNPRGKADSLDNTRDRSYGAKLLVLEEKSYRPSIAVGVNDILGTGLLEAEYLLMSKNISTFDLSLGLGWGRLAGKRGFENPLSVLGDHFKLRPSDLKLGGQYGGQSRSRSYFRGNTSLFGGFSYSSESKPIRFLLEYNSDPYSRESELQAFPKTPSRLNFGVQYEFPSGVKVGVSRLFGQFFGLTLSSSVNMKKRPDKKLSNKFYSSSETRALSNAPSHLDLTSWYDRFLFDSERSGLLVHSGGFNIPKQQLNLEMENVGYALTMDAIDKVLALARIHQPAESKEVRIFLRDEGFLGPTVIYRRHTRSQLKMPDYSSSSLLGKSRLEDYVIDVHSPSEDFTQTNTTSFELPRIHIGLDASSRFQLMDPNDPLRYQLYLKPSLRARITKKLDVWIAAGLNLTNNFSADRVSNSLIRKVRSDINEYLTKGETGIDQFFLEYRNNLSSTIIYRAYGGILEMMYGGVGVEALYAPLESRFGLGFTVNWLKQREFDKRFRFKKYQTATGYLSLFYASPFYNFDFAVHGGRYLGRDKGGTFEVRRSFDNGFSVGAFFTRTNISAKDFGEGSFDKGLFFKIPLNNFVSRNSKRSYQTIIRPLDRDGGRRLEDFSGTLWFSRRGLRFDSLVNNKDRIRH